MPRNPYWTPDNAALIISLYGKTPITGLSFSNLGKYENTTGQKQTSVLALNLKAGSAYSISSIGQYTTDYTIYDSSGYLITPNFDKNGFRPDADGVYYIVFGWKYLTDTISGWKYATVNEDVGADGVNTSALDVIRLAYGSILKVDPLSDASKAFALSKLDLIYGQPTDFAAATREIISKADATTSVATLSYQFFTGKIPSSGGVEYLVSPTGPNANNLNSAYYQSFNLENRYINFAVNLGKVGEGAAKFTAEYGSLSLFDATKKAYAAIFGGTPNDAKVQALLSGGRDLYFEAYGKDGLNGIGTKAAMVGWLLAEAEKGDLGVMARSNAAWLLDLSDGSAPYAIDILAPSAGYYKADFIFGG
jgi:hypothetical protein